MAFWNISNTLTILRMCSIPFVAILLLFSPGRWLSFGAAAIFFLAAISDWLDGYLARKIGVVSDIGKFLDPLADKLLVCTALVLLIPLGRVPAWIVAIIVAREVAVTTLRSLAVTEGIVIAASRLGKLKALSQLVATNLLILHYPYWFIDTHLLGTVALWIALCMTIWSGADYFVRFFARAKESGDIGETR